MSNYVCGAELQKERGGMYRYDKLTMLSELAGKEPSVYSTYGAMFNYQLP